MNLYLATALRAVRIKLIPVMTIEELEEFSKRNDLGARELATVQFWLDNSHLLRRMREAKDNPPPPPEDEMKLDKKGTIIQEKASAYL